MKLFQKMADKYQERIKDVEAMFEDVGDEVSKFAVSTAKRQTTIAKAVDTGNYRGSWTSRVKKRGLETEINLLNTADYASHLEFGHRIMITRGARKGQPTGKKTRGRFIGTQAISKSRRIAVKMLRSGLGRILK